MNRLVSVNLARALGSCLRADVIQYEGGLSRLAAEKEYDLLGLNRRFETARAFDAALRAVGAPDLGQLVEHIPLKDLVALSDTAQAQDFRDWFWSSAAGLLGSGADLTKTYLQQVQELVRRDLSAYQFPIELKLRYFESIGGQYLLGQVSKPNGPAFASTDAKGDETMHRQRLNFARHRQEQIRKSACMRGPYDPCPCNSGDKFRFCCGRSTSGFR